jgi:hypothetical protein
MRGDRRGIASRHGVRLVVYQLRESVRRPNAPQRGRGAPRSGDLTAKARKPATRVVSNALGRIEPAREPPGSGRRLLHKSNATFFRRAAADGVRQNAARAVPPCAPACPTAPADARSMPSIVAEPTDGLAQLNQLAAGLALCVLPSKNADRGDSTERTAHGSRPGATRNSAARRAGPLKNPVQTSI